jgi:hypothetical protein
MHEPPPFIFGPAVRHFWTTRDRQIQAQVERGIVDQGTRGAVTGGLQMDGFTLQIAERLAGAGVPRTAIYTRRGQSDLPGFYRPSKQWDLVVVVDGELVAAIELKSHVGPSFSNNFNNRTEEAMGSAVDIWTAYRDGAFRPSSQPWLGYLLLLEDCAQSRRPVAVRQPHFEVFPEFRATSYAQRYELFCLKLVRERQYSAACFLSARREDALQEVNYSEPSRELSAANFLEQLVRHARR